MAQNPRTWGRFPHQTAWLYGCFLGSAWNETWPTGNCPTQPVSVVYFRPALSTRSLLNLPSLPAYSLWRLHTPDHWWLCWLLMTYLPSKAAPATGSLVCIWPMLKLGHTNESHSQRYWITSLQLQSELSTLLMNNGKIRSAILSPSWITSRCLRSRWRSLHGTVPLVLYKNLRCTKTMEIH